MFSQACVSHSVHRGIITSTNASHGLSLGGGAVCPMVRSGGGWVRWTPLRGRHLPQWQTPLPEADTPLEADTPIGRNMGLDRNWHNTPWKEHGTRQEVLSYTPWYWHLVAAIKAGDMHIFLLLSSGTLILKMQEHTFCQQETMILHRTTTGKHQTASSHG